MSTYLDIQVRKVRASDQAALTRLWMLFRHDMSALTFELPNNKGEFRRERLDKSLSDPDWTAFISHGDVGPIGFALVRGLDSGERVLNSFFVVGGARRRGVGAAIVSEVVRRHPGAWAVSFQPANHRAVAFWRRVAEQEDAGRWTEVSIPVARRPDLPEDSWIRFTSRMPPKLASEG